MTRSPNTNESAIIVLHQGALGDFLLTLPVIQSVRQLHDRPRVIAVASTPAARLAAGRSVIDHACTPEAVGLHALFRDEGGIGPQLQGLFHLTKPKCILSFLTDTSHDIHQRLDHAIEGRVASLDPREKPGEGTHITMQWTDALREQGVNIANPQAIRIRLHDEKETTGKFIVIHPGSGARAKCWPIERFMAVADALRDHEVRWMLGPAECERDPQLHAQLKARITSRGESLIIEEDLINAARQLTGAALYLGNDSGMTHLAAALGIRTMAIFGTTDPHIWRPLGEHVQIIAPPEPADILNVETERVRRLCIEQMSG